MYKTVLQSIDDLANIDGNMDKNGVRMLESTSAIYMDTSAYGAHESIKPTQNKSQNLEIKYFEEFFFIVRLTNIEKYGQC